VLFLVVHVKPVGIRVVVFFLVAGAAALNCRTVATEGLPNPPAKLLAMRVWSLKGCWKLDRSSMPWRLWSLMGWIVMQNWAS